MITTVDNFQAESIAKVEKKDGFSFGEFNSKWFFHSTKLINGINITANSYCENKNNIFFSFFDKDEDKKQTKNSDDLILSISKKFDGSYTAQSGNYIGKFKHDNNDIEIKSRFGDVLLERMLNFANDVYLDDVSIFGESIKKDEIDYSKYIIYYLFIQSLEKAYLLGLPKAYTTVKHHESTLKGKIDINCYIKYDIPFRGKVSSISREQKEIQEIIDILYKAIKIISKEPKQKGGASYKGFLKNISHIVPHLQERKSNRFVTNQIINKALSSKALQNPIFAPYKKVLEYAKFIINGSNLEEKKDGKNKTYGFLVNVAELFEIYVTKLLQKEFGDWNVESPSLWLATEFKDNSYMYQRRIIPDIVMIENSTNNVIVFDTKYKRMKFSTNQYGSGKDIDRCDFFQINTYMNFYNNQEQYNLIVGGLLYPIEKNEKELINSHSQSWFGNNKIKFIVDGIDLSENLEAENDEAKFHKIAKKEKAFIERIRENITNQT